MEKVAKKEIDFSKRILEIDILRAIAVILMVVDHFIYDLAFLMPDVFIDFPYYKNAFWGPIVDFAEDYWFWDFRQIAREVVVFVFFMLTGICCAFSKNNLKRGLILLGFAMALTLGTGIIAYIMNNIDFTISFGALHCFALALIIIGLLEKIKTNKWVYLALGVVGFVLGTIFIQDVKFYSYKNHNIFEIIIGQILSTSMSGSDSIPFLFYGTRAFIGVFLGKLLYKERKPLFKWKYKNNFITFIGRNSLIFYLAHQVIIPLILGLILLICGFSFA